MTEMETGSGRATQSVARSLSMGLLLVLGLSGGILVTSPATAQEDPPTGGGTGCQSNGNCQGTMYKDKSNLNKWWWRRCSGCHTVQAPAPPEAAAPLSPADKQFLANPKAFWALHNQAKTDPVLRALLPKQRLKPIQTLPSEFRALVK